MEHQRVIVSTEQVYRHIVLTGWLGEWSCAAEVTPDRQVEIYYSVTTTKKFL